MPRVSMSIASRKRKNKVLKLAKGYRGGRSKLYRTAVESVDRALVYAYRGRKERKRDFRGLWIARINAAARMHGVTYSAFINGLNRNGIQINRKVLADLAVQDNAAFKAILDRAMGSV